MRPLKGSLKDLWQPGQPTATIEEMDEAIGTAISKHVMRK